MFRERPGLCKGGGTMGLGAWEMGVLVRAAGQQGWDLCPRTAVTACKHCTSAAPRADFPAARHRCRIAPISETVTEVRKQEVSEKGLGLRFWALSSFPLPGTFGGKQQK